MPTRLNGDCPPPSNPLWLWVKVALVLVVLELLLFHADLFWMVTPRFNEATPSETDNWRFVHQTARTIETRASDPPTVVVIGSSVLRFALDAGRANSALREKGIPVDVVPFISVGATASDSALVAWQSRTIRPWMIVYAAALRDFCMPGIVDSAVKRIFYDSSADLPVWPREGIDTELSAVLKRYWKLYRYRFFAERTLRGWGDAAVRAVLGPGSAQADAPPPSPAFLPAEAFRYFTPPFINAEGWAAWTTWRRSRRFEDYLRFIDVRGGDFVLRMYRAQTRAACGPTDNPHARALAWMLERMQAENVRTALLYAPENPVFFEREAMRYYDFALAIDYLKLFPATTEEFGASFENWRTALPAEDFYDMIHVNSVGRQKFTDRIVALIEREWRSAKNGEERTTHGKD